MALARFSLLSVRRVELPMSDPCLHFTSLVPSKWPTLSSALQDVPEVGPEVGDEVMALDGPNTQRLGRFLKFSAEESLDTCFFSRRRQLTSKALM